MSDNLLLAFKHSYTIVPIIMVLTVLFMYIDSKMTGVTVPIQSYLKSVLFVGVISIFLVYISTLKGQVYEDILKGPAPF